MFLLLNIIFIQRSFAQSSQNPPMSPTVNITINEDLKTMNQLIEMIQEVGGWLLVAAGALAVLFMIIGGIRYIISAGNPTQTEAAKKTIIYALVGVVVIALSTFMINAVIGLVNVSP